jgi:predicted ArsR family transcriptional regulator
MKLIGAVNRQKIIDFLHTHLGASYKDIAIGTGLSEGTVRDHMVQIKAEWRQQCVWRRSTLKRGEPAQLMLFNLSEHEAAMLGSQPQSLRPKGSAD